MFIFSIFTYISNFVVKFTKGFTITEILDRRMDVIQTTLLTIFVVTGFKPIFTLLFNIIIFCKDTIIGIFFPNKKLRNLEIKNAKQEYLEQQLIKKLDKINENQEKLQNKIATQRIKVSHWKDKKERKRLLKLHKNNQSNIRKDNENE
ncbi:putative membrane protein [Candidatus Phytoplasma solani]|uniref:hypothetical protein n=1 Tax=Candidatus Phytoplasma solani TaxID=69896 RepID=UPI0032DA83AF